METILAYSDCLNISTDHGTETKTISVSNENDFAGIIYSVVPKPVFTIRVTAKFFKERFPEENESEGLSNGQIVKLSGSIKTQKLLQLEPLPFYMHRILKLFLQHNYILIDGVQWEKEEAYETKEINERYPFELASVWLTQKSDSYIINIFGTV